ncbi:MAG: hypothetical protein HLUCCX14_14325 [Marinobacter excellens HL-55]|uniref:Uncharacterized protein n=1 Tax=Marinobacter excellens HL-55 TaxID=1305731 RepID=A0A0P8BGU8_9GAMM|nr:MAG: hypothetical protein HLUCCX14_14325 [Marinobacter excellens HL-55]
MTKNLPNGHELRWQPTELVTTLLSSGARQVIRCWLSPSRFLDEQHHPKMLLSQINDTDTFSDLVHTANGNLAPAVILNELLRKGIVETVGNGYILLRRSAYAPASSQAAQPKTNHDEVFGLHPPKRRSNDV